MQNASIARGLERELSTQEMHRCLMSTKGVRYRGESGIGTREKGHFISFSLANRYKFNMWSTAVGREKQANPLFWVPHLDFVD